MFYDIQITPVDTEIVDFLICISTYISVAYIFCKLLNIFLEKTERLFHVLSGICLSVLFVFLEISAGEIARLIMYLPLPMIIAFVCKTKAIKSILIAYISLGLFSLIKTISSLFVSLVLFLLGLTYKVMFVEIANIGLSMLLCFLFAKNNRLKRGIQYLSKDNGLGLGVAISGIIILINCISIDYNTNVVIIILIIALISVISGFGLYLWIRRSITAHYRERLQLKSEEHYQVLLSEKEQEIEKLNQSNEYLAKVVHRDNHLMSSLNSSIDAYFESNDTKFRDELLRDIQTLAKERGELIAKEQREAKILPSTGNPLIDGAINDLYTKAAAHGIDFSLTVAAPVGEVIGKFISQTDLQTLICDHIKDAVIAVEATGEGKGKILVEFAMNNGSYSVTVFDSGIAFEPETLAKLGKERVTTHADNGGSGIGFMTTFETLRKAHAGLKITEFETKTPFTKSVSFRFNGENTFTIQSYRSDMLREVLQREDIVIL